MITEESLDLKLYSSDPIYVKDIPVKKVSLKEIAQIGISEFNPMLSLMCASKDDFDLPEELQDAKYFDILFDSSVRDKSVRKSVYGAFKVFCGEEPTVDVVERKFVFPSFSISKEEFDEFQMIVRRRNGVTKKDEDEFNPANEQAQKIIERMKAMRRKVARSKKNENDTTLGQLLSAFASGLNLTLDEVMEYDLFQFNDQLQRLKMFKDYDTSIQALVHGAKAEDVKLKHWLSKPVENE